VEIIGIGRVRNRLREVVEMAQAGPVTITRNGEAAAVMIGPDHYESLVATVDLLSNPDYRRKMDELKRTPNEYLTQTQVETELRASREAP
jgi:prevent-host-death family protein